MHKQTPTHNCKWLILMMFLSCLARNATNSGPDSESSSVQPTLPIHPSHAPVFGNHCPDPVKSVSSAECAAQCSLLTRVCFPQHLDALGTIEREGKEVGVVPVPQQARTDCQLMSPLWK